MFSYFVPTNIRFGEGQALKLADVLPEVTVGRRLMLVTDPGVLKAGLVDPILDSLRTADYTVEVFSQVAQNPRDTDCVIGARQFADMKVDTVIGIGGGSAMDTAKAIALLAPNGGVPLDYVEGRLPYANIAPIVCMPTTAGTGSEVTRSSVITEAATHRKLTLKDAALRPKLAVLDPLLTLTVPPSVTAATGVDALVHAIEGYTCRQSSPITRAFGAAAMRVIVPALPRAFADGRDVEARTAMLEGSLLAGLCFGSSDVAAVHCLAEALGSLYDTPHGVANSIFLPEVLRYNAESNLELHAEIAKHMGLVVQGGNSVGTGAGMGIVAADADAVANMLESIGAWTKALHIPTLRELGYVRAEDFDRIAQLSLENNSTPSNVRPIGLSDYRAILERVYGME